jgi:hypothetical protein
MTEKPEPEAEPAQNSGDQAQDAEDPEVVAHFDDGSELPWCIGCIS